jgi:hypothetical protein
MRPLVAAALAKDPLARPAVLRAWPRLRGWVESERAGLGVHQRIRQAVRLWDVTSTYRPASTTATSARP